MRTETDRLTEFTAYFIRAVTDDESFQKEVVDLTIARDILARAVRENVSVELLGLSKHMTAERMAELENDLVRLSIVQKYSLIPINQEMLDRAHTLHVLMNDLIDTMKASGVPHFLRVINIGHND